MDHQHFHQIPSEHAHVAVNGGLLDCHLTPAGNWICCAEKERHSCARGFTIEIAAANWERAQELAE